ncbi:sushi, von Willebrand factor type A, EGF and pentraxin domain-containing protein 1-like [Amblyomma americanum]
MVVKGTWYTERHFIQALLTMALFVSGGYGLRVGATRPCSVPPPDLTNGRFIQFEERRTAVYYCDDEFWLSGPPQLCCSTFSNGSDVWMPEQTPVCQPFENCATPVIERGGYRGECCEPFDEVTFYCSDERRFRLSGAPFATCLPNGTWSHPTPSCHDRNCKDPGHVENSNRRVLWLGHPFEDEVCCPPLSRIEYECLENYAKAGPEAITCSSDGTWSSSPPICLPKVTCDEIVVPGGWVYGDRSGGDSFLPGDRALVACGADLHQSDTGELICGDDGKWKGVVPRCRDCATRNSNDCLKEYNCTRFEPRPHLHVTEFAAGSGITFREEATIQFKCERGYVLRGTLSATCRSGNWFPPVPICENILCGTLAPPRDGWMTSDNSTAFGAVKRFGCFRGYHLVGPDERRCSEDGQWDGTPPRCEPSELGVNLPATCADPGPPDNGVAAWQTGRDEILFACNSDYTMRGSAVIRCLPSGQMSAQSPICVNKYYFDKAHEVLTALVERLQKVFLMSTARLPSPYSSRPSHFLYFLLDAPRIINDKAFRIGIAFATAITRKVRELNGGRRLGAFALAGQAKLVINPTNCSSEEIDMEEMESAAYNPSDGHLSINTNLQNLRRDIAIVRRFRHRKTAFTVFLVTGASTHISGTTVQLAEALHSLYGVDIHCIGIRGGSESMKLGKLASPHVQEHLFMLKDYDALQWLADFIVKGTIEKHCQDPGDIINGGRLLTRRNRPYQEYECCLPETEIAYSCNEEFELVGYPLSNCLPNGTWTHPKPQCKRKEACSYFQVPHGQVSWSRSSGHFFSPGDIANVTCDPGFRIYGPDHLFCDDDGQWDDQLPSCISEQNGSKGLQAAMLSDPTCLEAEIEVTDMADDGFYMYFLLDSSKNANQEGFRKSLMLSKVITRKMKMRRGAHRVGAIVYKREPELVVDPLAGNNAQTALEKLGHINHTGGYGSLKAGLQKLHESIRTVKNVTSGDAKFLAFIMIHGNASITPSTKALATQLKNQRVAIYCIGITGNSRKTELEKLVTSPAHLFLLKDYDAFHWIADKVTGSTIGE